ncbi:MAG: ATP-binding protein, partial [Bacteroidota bacterium]
MNGVIGMTSLLRHTSLTDEQQEFVDTIRLSGDALLTIINDILDFSKIESEQLELEEQPFPVRQCVEEALDLLALAGYDKGLELAYRMAPDVPEHVVGDVTRLRQVLVNLLSNAIKFTEQGRVTVEVETADTSTADALVLAFAVADTGIGIPVDRMDRLFEPFRQVDASTTRQHGGTGLGLAISRRLCEAMGGTITVTSEVGQGSVFRSTVRVARAEVAAPRLDGADGLRIMLVEPRAFSREALAETLAQQGMHVTAYAAWPAELPTPRPAWVVMAPASGASLATAVAKLRQRWPSGPVVALVPPGRHTAVPTVQTMPLPVKPLRLAQLLAQVDRSPHREAGEITEDLPDLAEAYPLRVLLVEDNPVNQKVGSQLMQRAGYHPDLASDGQEAVDAMQRQDYDVVLMDMHMPTMDGLTATRHIRAQERPGQRLPYIIGMTANVLPEDQQRCLESGMDDFVAKPVRPEALYEALRRAAQARPASVS